MTRQPPDVGRLEEAGWGTKQFVSHVAFHCVLPSLSSIVRITLIPILTFPGNGTSFTLLLHWVSIISLLQSHNYGWPGRFQASPLAGHIPVGFCGEWKRDTHQHPFQQPPGINYTHQNEWPSGCPPGHGGACRHLSDTPCPTEEILRVSSEILRSNQLPSKP